MSSKRKLTDRESLEKEARKYGVQLTVENAEVILSINNKDRTDYADFCQRVQNLRDRNNVGCCEVMLCLRDNYQCPGDADVNLVAFVTRRRPDEEIATEIALIKADREEKAKRKAMETIKNLKRKYNL